MTVVEDRLSLEWELWVVEQLLFTGKRDDVVDLLADHGVPRPAAREQVERVLASDGFARLRHHLGEGIRASQLARLAAAVRPGPLTIRDHIDADGLLRDHWIPSRPAKLTAAVPSLRALTWRFEGLRERFGGVEVSVNVSRRRATTTADIESRTETWTLASLVDRIEEGPSDDFYAVSRNGLLATEGLAPLWDDLSPLPSFLAPVSRPRGVSLWMGPAGTHTRAHFDPHNVLLVQVEGHKRVSLAPPASAADHTKLDGYYLRGGLAEVYGDRVTEVTLAPGEALFVPVAWFHEVVALAPSLTLSFLNFRWPNHFHWLGPPGSDDRR